MKSLSILVLLGSLSAIILGAIFAVTPVLARSSASQPETNLTVSQPVTGKEANAVGVAAPAVNLNADETNTTPAESTVNFKKDTASSQAAQEAQSQLEQAAKKQATFQSFVQSVSNGNANQVTGIYVEDVLAYSVARQPKNDAAFVSSNPDTVTQFAMAGQYGSLAFLAHNTLAGASFFSLTEGQTITLVYGDGSTQDFRIASIQRYQALSPNSTQSDFKDLDSGKELSNSTLFHSMYNSDNSVVLQTCIAKDGISTWGRLFVIAVPLS